MSRCRVTDAERKVRDRVAAHLVGRERELDLLLAAVAAGRDVLLEGIGRHMILLAVPVDSIERHAPHLPLSTNREP